MTFQLQPEVPVFVGIFLVTASLLGYGLQQYHRRGRKPELRAFIALLFVISVWQLTAIFINIVTIPELIFAGNNFGNVVLVPGLVYSLAWFALTYTNHTQWVNRWTAGVAVGAVGVVGVAVALDPTFLIEPNGLTTQGPLTAGGITFTEWVVLDLTLTPAFQLYQLYGYAIMLLSGGILARYLLRNRGELYTGQAAALLIGIGAVIGTNSLLFAGVLPPEWNLTHVSFGITAVAFAIAIFRYRLLEVAPIGRKQLVEQLADPVIMLDKEERVVDCNPAARQLVDAPEGWRGMSAEGFFASFSASRERFTTAGSGEITLSEAEGERNFTIDSTPINNGDTRQTGQLIRLHEITEQKKRQRQLEEQNEHLDEFASIVSHDLRSPLNVAQGRLKIAGWECDSEELAKAEKALNRMESMIDDLLTMARSSQTIKETTPVTLANTAKTAWTYSDVDDCTLHNTISKGLTIEADRDRLLQVFENVFGNAAEHNETPVNVSIGVLGEETRQTDGGERSGFYVADDGAGIPEEARETVFDSGYSGAGDGTGFGLAIVEDIVTAHGWEITVTDSDEGGARFEITGVTSISH